MSWGMVKVCSEIITLITRMQQSQPHQPQQHKRKNNNTRIKSKDLSFTSSFDFDEFPFLIGLKFKVGIFDSADYGGNNESLKYL